MLTREQFNKMKETQLQTEVLIPLFEAMGFRDVHLHQGSNEIGKDIVMWRSDAFGQRENYAVVAKAKKVTGNVRAASGVTVVKFQVEQAFGSTWNDPVTLKEHRADKCIVVSSKGITNDAITAIKASLASSNLDKLVTFIPGDELWRLVREHAPERMVVHDLRRVQQILDGLHPDYRIVAKTTGEFYVQQKSSGSHDDEPIKGSCRIEFPDTEEGRKAHEDFKQHIKKGVGVKIPSAFVKDFSIPEVLRPVIGVTAGEGELKIGPNHTAKPLLVKIEFNADSGERAVLDYAHLEGIIGTDEIALSNKTQPVPWRVELRINMPEGRFHFDFHAVSPMNVKQALDSFRFLEVIHKGGKLRIEHIETGFPFINQRLERKGRSGENREWLRLLEKLSYIQIKTAIPISVSDEDRWTDDEVRLVWATAQILKTGKSYLRMSELPLTMHLDQLPNFLSEFGDGGLHPIAIDGDNHKIRIQETDIFLGPVLFTCEQTFLAAEELTRLQSLVDSDVGQGTVETKVVVAQGKPVTAHFKDWLQPDEDEENEA